MKAFTRLAVLAATFILGAASAIIAIFLYAARAVDGPSLKKAHDPDWNPWDDDIHDLLSIEGNDTLCDGCPLRELDDDV